MHRPASDDAATSGGGLLTPASLVQYLGARGLLGDEAIVAGGLTVTDMSRRNHNFSVVCQNGPCFMVKQGVGADGASTIRREATAYRSLEGAPDRSLPRLHHYDSDRAILVLEFLRDAPTLRDTYARTGRFPTSHAATMGDILAGVHTTDCALDVAVAHERPWIASLHRTTLQILENLSTGNIELIKILQQYPELCRLVDEASDAWETSSLIHFDIKFDNWLLPGRGGSRCRRLTLVDWELAGYGDPCWDVGSVFATYLDFWLSSIPITGETPPSRLPELARYPLARMQPALRGFWTTYARAMRLSGLIERERLVRSTEYAALRLLQTAFEQGQFSVKLSGPTIYLVQLSRNMLMRPAEAAAVLLGLPFVPEVERLA